MSRVRYQGHLAPICDSSCGGSEIRVIRNPLKHTAVTASAMHAQTVVRRLDSANESMPRTASTSAANPVTMSMRLLRITSKGGSSPHLPRIGISKRGAAESTASATQHQVLD